MPATTAGLTAWATSRPTATACPATRRAPTTPTGYVAGGPATGGTNGWYDCDNLVNDSPNNDRPARAPAHDRHGHGRGQGAPRQPLVQPRQPGRQRVPGVPASPRRRHGARLRRAEHAAVPVRDRQRPTVMDGPVYRYDGNAARQLAPLAQVLGRPLVPARQRRRERQARRAARPGHRPGRRPAGLRRQPARLAIRLDGQLHGLQVRARRRLVRADLRRLLPRGAGRRHLAYRLHRRPATPRWPRRRATAIGALKVKFSSAGSGGVSYEWDFGDGSATSDRGQPDAHVSGGRPLRRQADGHVRRRRHRRRRPSAWTCSRRRTTPRR